MADDAPTTDEVAVLVPAAGRGTRLGGVRKQFRRLGDAPVLVQTLRAFDRHPDVQHLVVAAPPGEARATGDELHDAGLRKLTAVVPGGSSRQASVAHALRAVPSSVAVVLVHDAVRPFLAPGRIAAVVAAVRAQGAAALAVPVADTLRAADADGRFGATVPREGLYRMQTPQGFRRAWLEAAHATADGPPRHRRRGPRASLRPRRSPRPRRPAQRQAYHLRRLGAGPTPLAHLARPPRLRSTVLAHVPSVPP